MSTYVFADRPDSDQAHHHGQLVDLLADVLDPFTRRRLEPLLDPPGHTTKDPDPSRVVRCLEVGAGAGTIARWLAERIDQTVEVTATDVDVSRIPQRSNLLVRQHDIATDPLEPAAWDLIHARLVLGHQPQRRKIVAEKLIPALAPGGWLVIEEFDPAWDTAVVDSPDPDAVRLFTAYHHALLNVLTTAGSDPTWGRSVHRLLEEHGLVEVGTEWYSRAWRGDSAGCLLPHTLSAQVRPQLRDAGMTEADIDAFRGLLTDRRLLIRGNPAVSICGRRP